MTEGISDQFSCDCGVHHNLVARKACFAGMRREGFSFYFGGMGVETCSLDAAFVSATMRNHTQPSATACNRSQPFASDLREGNMAVPSAYGRVLQKLSSLEVSIVE